MPEPQPADGCGGGGSDTWWIGVAGTIFGCFVSNFGTNIQKVSLDRNSALPQLRQRSSFRQPLWVAGCVCMIAGAIADFAVLPFAPQSLLAPLATTTLVFNVAMANILSKERPTCTNIVATATILAGTVLVVVFGDRCAPTYRSDELVKRFEATPMIIYIVLVSVALLCGAVASVVLDRKAETSRVPITQRKSVAFMMAAVGGIFGGNTILCAKTVGELIKTSIDALGDDSSTAGLASEGIWNWATPVFLLALVGNLLLRESPLRTALPRTSTLRGAASRRFLVLTSVPMPLWRCGTYALEHLCASDWARTFFLCRGPILERCAIIFKLPIFQAAGDCSV
jgi:drug/metabolite transporter (DMT)-like permease